MDRRLKSVLVVMAAAIICCFSNSFAFAQGTGASLNPDIASLETRFFDHTYPQESMDARLDRLERMVFGEQKTGSDQARLTALLLAVPAEPAASSPASPGDGTGQTTASSDTPTTSPSGQSDQPSQGNGSSDTSSAPGDVTNSSDYPRITQLEQEILGKTFTNEPIQNRLEQLELKAFGKAKTNVDLADRTEALEDYADKHFPQQQRNYAETADGAYPSAAPQYAQYPQQSGYSNPAYSNPAAFSVNSIPPHATLDQKVTWLEKQVLGATYPTQPLLDRVNRLAANIFPADSPQRTQSLADQVSSMIGAVELMPKQGSASVAQAPQYGQPPQYGQAPEYNQTPQYSPPPFSQYPQTQQYGATPNYPGQYDQSTALAGTPTTQAAPTQSHGHSFMHGLAHVLGTVGQMAAGSAGSMMMGGMGGGYGMPFGL